MGQKVHPYSLRLGINTTWKSKWYRGSRDYADTLHEDLKLRSTLLGTQEAKSADIADVIIIRKPDSVTLLIHTARPGIVIGSKGANIEKIQKKLQKITEKRVNIKIQEIKRPETSAKVISENIARQLRGRTAFKRATKMAISSAMKAGVQGIKIKLSGRLGGAEMARSIETRDGRVPLHTLRANIDYGFSESMTSYGVIGVKVWVFHGEIYRNDITRDDAGAIVKRNAGPEA